MRDLSTCLWRLNFMKRVKEKAGENREKQIKRCKKKKKVMGSTTVASGVNMD